MRPELMVKQFVARLRVTSRGRVNVFETGDLKYYLFDPIDEAGCSKCNAVLVEKRRLRREIRRALRHRHGNTL